MTIGIIGGNSSVGLEACVLLRGTGEEVVPIVRSKLASAVFDQLGLDSRIADIADRESARKALTDLETVVIAAFAPSLPPHGAPRQARQRNEKLITNSARYAPDSSTIVYLSSVMAFGEDIFPDYENTIYPREKRHLENWLRDAARGAQTTYVLRLGHVNGPVQDITRTFETTLAENFVLPVRTDADRPSNMVHTVTIADAIQACHRREPEAGRYTVVNEPQWSWREFLEHYDTSGTDLRFLGSPQSDESIVERLIGRIWAAIHERRTSFIPYMVYLPENLNQRIIHLNRLEEVSSNIAYLKSDATFDMHHFRHEPAPGRTLPGLESTRGLLNQERFIRQALID